MTASFTMELRPGAVGAMLARKRDEVAGAIRDRLAAGTERLGRRALERVREHTPSSSGTVREGWVLEVTPYGFRLYNRLSRTEAGRRELEAIEFGTRSHPIAARRARVLRFRDEDGRTIFRRRVQHPGTRAYAPVRVARGIAALELAELRRAVAADAARAWERR